MYAIEIDRLTKRFRDKLAVSDLSLAVNEGELLSLLGVNGAGKSTTIKILCGLTVPTSGEAKICGIPVTERGQEAKSLVNLSPQETAVAPNLTARENLELMCTLYGDDFSTARKKSEAMISSFRLEEIAQRKAKVLSGGWARKLSIAMALITNPRVLFLDEPTLGLDVLARRELWEVIRGLKGKTTVVLTTHYLEEAEALSDRIAVLSQGRLVALGTSDELIEKTNAKNFEDAFVSLCKGGAL